MPTQLFINKIALVTGSGRGIGKAIALHFAQHGADVVINFFRNRVSAEEIAREIEKLGRRALLVKADVGDLDDTTRCSMKLRKNLADWIFSSTMRLRDITVPQWNRSPKAGIGQ